MKTSFTVLILLLASTSFSQNYKMALGFKGGYPGYGSLNAKKSISKSDYLEASIGGFGRNSYSTGFHVELDYERMQALEEGFSFSICISELSFISSSNLFIVISGICSTLALTILFLINCHFKSSSN